jgi:hypothetical protein
MAAQVWAAGPLIIGGRGGTDLVTSRALDLAGAGSSSRNFSVGPTAGVRLPLGFSVEGDALYHRQTIGAGIPGLGGLNTHWDWWEFPVMLRFTPGSGPIAPTVGAGVSVQHINNFGAVPSYLLTGRSERNSIGFVAGGGVQFRMGALQVTPELRYTRWNSGSWVQTVADTFLGRNQVQFLVGFTF